MRLLLRNLTFFVTCYKYYSLTLHTCVGWCSKDTAVHAVNMVQWMITIRIHDVDGDCEEPENVTRYYFNQEVKKAWGVVRSDSVGFAGMRPAKCLQWDME